MNFFDPRYRPAQQGQLDGFCGVYSVVNFVSRREGLKPLSDTQKQVFQRLLELLKDQDKLTPSRIRSGFREGQIQKAFNQLAAQRQLGVRARSLKSYARKIKAAAILDVLLSLAPDEAAMVHMDKHDHWVLAHSAKGDQYITDDSSDAPKPVKMTSADTRKAKIGISDGLVFLNA